MELVAVPFPSADLTSIGYDPDRYEMQVQFSNGSVYSYAGVEPDTYAALLEGGSAYFHQIIKPQRTKYVFTRLV